MSEKRILITGATGFIGQHLALRLLDEGLSVILLVRDSYAAGQPLPPSLAARRDQFELVFADLRNFNLTVRALRDATPSAVIHLAAAGSAEPFLNPEVAIRHNVNGTLNLIRAAFEKTFTTTQMVIARTPGELTHMNTYAASKLAGWDFARMYARTQRWPIYGAMIFQCFGAGQPSNVLIPAATRAALADADFPMTAGTQARDWIHVSDVVAGLAAFLGPHHLQPGETVDLGSGDPVAVAEVVRKIFRLSASQGKPLIGKLPSRPGEAQVQIADVAHTRAKLNWEPQLTLDEGLRQFIATQRPVKNQ